MYNLIRKSYNKNILQNNKDGVYALNRILPKINLCRLEFLVTIEKIKIFFFFLIFCYEFS